MLNYFILNKYKDERKVLNLNFAMLTKVSLVHYVCCFRSMLKQCLYNKRTAIFQRNKVFLLKGGET